MNIATLALSLNDDLIDLRYIKKCTFSISIDEITPTIELILGDSSGEFLGEFNHISIGSRVQISILEAGITQKDLLTMTDKDKAVIFPPLLISSIQEDPDDIAQIAGFIKITAVAPWVFYKDTSSHAYKGIPNSEIIKSVLSSEGKSVTFNMDLAKIDESDEDGSIPRYKTAESDFEFIHNKLLPVTTIGGQPPLFWIGESNEPHLTSFNSLFQNNSKALATINSMSVAQELGEDVSKLISDCENTHYGIGGMRVKIGDENPSAFLPYFRVGSIIDPNMITGGAVETVFEPSLSISKSEGGKKYPFYLPSFKIIGKTSQMAFSNRQLADMNAILGYSMKDFYRLFRVEIHGTFLGEKVKVGDCISLWVMASGTGNKRQHWLSGKWLVEKAVHYLEIDKMQSTFILSRPTFLYEPKKTTLSDIPLLLSMDR